MSGDSSRVVDELSSQRFYHGTKADLTPGDLRTDMPGKKPSAKNASLEPDDWRSRSLARVRALIKQADPDIVEELKWQKASNPVVKLTFARGAALTDPSGLFNASLEGNVRRAIDIRDGGTIDAEAFKALVRAAVALNSVKPTARQRA
jgi:hypothetical protein